MHRAKTGTVVFDQRFDSAMVEDHDRDRTGALVGADRHQSDRADEHEVRWALTRLVRDVSAFHFATEAGAQRVAQERVVGAFDLGASERACK